MNAFNELVKEADRQRKQQQYLEAQNLYRQAWEEYPTMRTKWIGWGLAYCHYKNGKHHEALEICRMVYKMDSSFENNRSLYAWTIYHTAIKITTEASIDEALKAGNAIKQLVSVHDPYSPIKQTIASLVRLLGNKEQYASELLSWCNIIDENRLDDTPRIVGKESDAVEMASIKETIMVAKCKAYYSLGFYSDCIAFCIHTMAHFKRFHHGNEVWLRRLIAKSEAKLGNLDKAIALYQKIKVRKRDFFIVKELGDLYLEQGEKEKALQAYFESVLAPGDINLKVSLYRSLIDLLEGGDRQQLCRKVGALYVAVRLSNGWNLSPDIMERYAQTIDTHKERIDVRVYERQVRAAIEEMMGTLESRIVGVVYTILPNGMAGFIRTKDGHKYYFRKNGTARNVNIGEKVSFALRDSFDAKKNAPSKEAVGIKIVADMGKNT